MGVRSAAHLVAAVFLPVVTMIACGDDDRSAPTNPAAAVVRTTLSNQAAQPERLPESPLAQMAIAFDGNYSEAEIQRQLDQALVLHGESVTDDNYSRAGSTLVTLSNENGVSEMAILNYMICSHVPEVALSFPDAAAFAAVLLRGGDSCS